jgi:hypothetical protein
MLNMGRSTTHCAPRLYNAPIYKDKYIRTASQGLRCSGRILRSIGQASYKAGTHFGTQKFAERAVEAVDAVNAVRIFLGKFSAC